MTVRLVVAGTDTGVGKTVLSAALVAALQAHYWKPVQCGVAGETDSETVARLADLPQSRILPGAYRLDLPASAHLAAEHQGLEIDVARLVPPASQAPLVIELAGGLMVPLTRRVLQIDVLARWRLPVILCASTRLGTINHSLLSLEALKRRAIPVLGVAFIGEEQADSERTIAEIGGVRLLGRLPHIDPLTPETLRAAFSQHFDPASFVKDPPR
jgi:dethiobiotin synthetase